MPKFKCLFNGVVIEIAEKDAREIRENPKYEEIDPSGVPADLTLILEAKNKEIEELKAKVARLKDNNKKKKKKKKNVNVA